MSYLPQMPAPVDNVRRQVIEFKGYSNAAVIEDGEMRDMMNLSSNEYPTLTQRLPRELYSDSIIRPNTMLSWKSHLYIVATVNGTTSLFIDDTNNKLIDLAAITDGKEKVLVPINQKLCIFPDKVCYNLVTGVKEALGANLSGQISEITTNKIAFKPGIALTDFSVGDTVRLTGFTVEKANNVSAKIKSISNTTIVFPDNTFTIPDSYATSADYTNTIKVERPIPDMDFIMESNNRLWGCKGNSIYSCKLGDPKNWIEYSLLADSAYWLDVGSDGDFTGCAAYPDHLLFFKEDCIHKIYGSNKPSTYQLVTIQCYGLEAGSHKSVCCINSVLYYKSRAGIMAYSAGYPALITQNFKTQYINAVAGTDLMKYYVSMEKADGSHDFFAYDLNKRMWHLEDDTNASLFSYHNGRLMYIDADKQKLFYVYGSDPIPEEERLSWSATFGEYDEYIENKKIYSKIQMRMEMEPLSELTVSIAVDGKPFEQQVSLYADTKRTMYLPLVPRRCDRFALKVEGKGKVKILSITRLCREGSGL